MKRLTETVSGIEGGGSALPATLPEEDYDYGPDEGAGLDDVDARFLVTPFLVVLQANSPQCLPVRSGGLEGAAAGYLLNTGTGALFDGEGEGVGFMPCGSEERYVEFYPRREDGSSDGFVGVRGPEGEVVLALQAGWDGRGEVPVLERGADGRSRWIDSAGRPAQMGAPWTGFGKLSHRDAEGRPTELIQTLSLYGFTVGDWEDPSTFSRVCVPFSSTKIMTFRRFITASKDLKYPRAGGFFRPPVWAHRWRLNTFLRHRGNNHWYIPTMSLWAGPTDTRASLLRPASVAYQVGKEFHELISGGKVTATYEEVQGQDGADDGPLPF